MIQVMLRKTVRPVSSTPRVMKIAMVPRRRGIFMLVKSVYLVERISASRDPLGCDVADEAAHDASCETSEVVAGAPGVRGNGAICMDESGAKATQTERGV